MAAAKSLTPAEIQNALAFIASGANPERNRCLFLMSVMAGLRVSATFQHSPQPTQSFHRQHTDTAFLLAVQAGGYKCQQPQRQKDLPNQLG